MSATYAQEAAIALADRLQSCPAKWVLGGSTALAMRGAALQSMPRDIDLYADADEAQAIHEHLQPWATDKPHTSMTNRYRSVLSHYTVAGCTVELVGAFEIATEDSRYMTEVKDMLHPYGDSILLQEAEVRLVPLGHELIFNVLRQRPDRCEIIGQMIRQQPAHLPPLHKLVQRNALSPKVVGLISSYLDNRGREKNSDRNL